MHIGRHEVLSDGHSAGVLSGTILDKRRSAVRQSRADLLPGDASRITHSRMRPRRSMRLRVRGFDDYPCR